MEERRERVVGSGEKEEREKKEKEKEKNLVGQTKRGRETRTTTKKKTQLETATDTIARTPRASRPTNATEGEAKSAPDPSTLPAHHPTRWHLVPRPNCHHSFVLYTEMLAERGSSVRN